MHPVSGVSPTKLEVWAILGSKDTAGGGRAGIPLLRSDSSKRRVRFSPGVPDSCPGILPLLVLTYIDPLRSSSLIATLIGCWTFLRIYIPSFTCGAPTLVRIRVSSLGRPARDGTPGASGITRPSPCAPGFLITGLRFFGGREFSFPPARLRRKGCGVRFPLKISWMLAPWPLGGGNRAARLLFSCNFIFVSSFFVITRTSCKCYM